MDRLRVSSCLSCVKRTSVLDVHPNSMQFTGMAKTISILKIYSQ